uniref:2-amino-3-ketobutyrate coenzyme A ligase, mitochondrial n=2 Tax=Hirondellea gigas TaxID=1518452 RepID=A0A6A7G5G0_9CRUS
MSAKFSEVLIGQLQEIRKGGLFKTERVITSAQETSISVWKSDKPVLNFCANNYLGLSNDPRLVAAVKKTVDTHGFGLSSVRFICGTQDIHIELEKKISQFHGTDDALLYASCYDANTGFFETVLTKDDAIISDKLNHASIIDGIRLCKAQRFLYDHMNMRDLEEKLKDSQHCRFRMIATDGCFSMDGDITPLADIVKLAKQYDALVFMDECHAAGFLGKTGRGTSEYHNVIGQVDVISNTLGKALGGATGGYLTGRQYIIDYLRQKSRPYLFSNSLAPPLVGASIECLNIISNDTSLRDKLAENTKRFRQGMMKVGFQCMGHPDHPICPILLKDAQVAADVADEMLKKGIYVIGFSYPVVPRSEARIRVQLSAAHSEEDIDRCIAAFAEIGKQKGII